MQRLCNALRLVIATVLVLCLPMDAYAGQLHVQWITLGEVARHGLAVLGTIVSIQASEQIVTIRIKRLWQRKDNADKNFISSLESAYSENTEHEFKIYTGVVWDNPHESPIDRRVPGALHLNEVKIGEDVVLVSSMGNEMLPANQKTLKKLDLFFSDTALDEYVKTAPAEMLYADLNDLDLREPALDAICARKLLKPEAFLRLEPRLLYMLGWELGNKVGHQLTAKEFNEWLLGMIKAAKDTARREEINNILSESSFADKVGAQTRLALIESLDLSHTDEQYILGRYIRDEFEAWKATPDIERAKRTMDLALSFEAVRRDSSSWNDMELLRVLNESLPRSSQIDMVKRIGRLVMTSRRAKESEQRFDDELFELFVAQVRQAPATAFLKELEAIDLSHIEKTSQGRVEYRVAILDAGLAISEADPASADSIYAALEKWIRHEEMFHPDIILSIDEEKPGEKQQRWSATLNKFKALKR